MDLFCVNKNTPLFTNGSHFKNESYSNTIPRISDCYQQTTFYVLPAFFLFIFSPLVIYDFQKSTKGPLLKRTTTLRIFLCGFLLVNVLVQIVYFSITNLELNSSNNLYGPLPVGKFLSLFLLAISLLLALILMLGCHKFGLATSGVLFNYWFLLAFCGIPRFREAIELWFVDNGTEKDHFASLLFILYYLFVLKILFVSCFADRSRTDEFSTEKTCPEPSVSFLNKILFWWFNSIARLGNMRALIVDDLWLLSERDKSKHLSTKFEKIREKQFNSYNKQKIKRKKVKTPFIKQNKNGIEETELLKKSTDNKSDNEYLTKTNIKENTSPPSLIWALFLTFKFPLFGAIFYKIIHDLLQFASPKLLDLLLQFMETPEANIWNGIGIAIGMFLLNFVQSMFIHQYFHIMFRVGMNIRSILTSSIYKKSLLLSSSARTKRTTGEIVNLMTVDIQRFQDMASWINFMWSAPFQVLLSLFFLFQLLGVSVIAGLICLIAFIPINTKLTLAMRSYQQKQMTLKDERLKFMNEILNGIKVFKLYAWEESIEDRILAIRKKELLILRRIAYLNAISSMAWSCAPFLVAVSTFSAYLWLDPSNNVLTPRITFVALSYFNILRFPLAIFPMVGSQAVQCNVSNKRLKTFLAEDELNSLPTINNNTFGYSSISIALRNASFSWSEEEPILLKNLNIEIKRGSLVAIVGRIGSGKSSLLSAILGEMYCKSGTVEIDGKVAYVPQQAWIQNMSLKENILFGNTFNKQLYDIVIDTCSLQQDLDSLPGGDSIEIGEKGINLSGGQKQRISLARAAYQDSDIYFLDDPLSAVDSHVGKHIFDKLISSENGLLKTKTRVLVTHGLSFLKHCDQIIVIKDGQITESGTYHDLLKSSGELSEIIEEYLIKQQSTTDIGDEQNDDEIMDVLDELEKIHPEKSKLLSARRVTSESESSGKIISPQKESSTAITFQKIIPSTKIIEKEEVFTGKVKFGVYLEYVRAVGWISFTFFLFIYLFASVLGFACNLWLAKWSDKAEEIQKGNSTFSNETTLNLIIYTSLGIAQAFTVAFGSVIMAIGMIKASRKLHKTMLTSVLRSPMSWFDITPLGRIMNRFGKDVDSLDSEIPRSFASFLRTLLASAEILAMISYATPQFMLCIVPLAIFYGLVLRYYVSTSRQLKRLESTTRSPIYSHFQESVQGASSIRAYNCVDRFLTESQKRVDNNMVIYFSSIVANRWLAVRLELVGNFIIFFSAFSAVLFRYSDHVTAGLVGLSVSYALSVTQVLNWAVRMASELETNIVSVERIKEYKETPNEAALETSPEVFKEIKGEFWPEHGEIQIDNLQLRYRQNLDLVLKDVNAHILPHEKIGIVGRTGAGKSSLVLALFRLVEPASGRIIIDGIDISKLGLRHLRSRLTIVPQDPVLFSGTFRDNLDPFSKYSDERIWSALKLTYLDEFVNSLPDKLNNKISEGGGNLSVGQRQLICLARAVLRQSKILVLDEAAASVDLETDHLIQQTIRRQFVDCTVLTIAHRLHSVLDSTRILVFSEGRVAEFDTPINLFSRQDSLFHSLAIDAGINNLFDVKNSEEKEE